MWKKLGQVEKIKQIEKKGQLLTKKSKKLCKNGMYTIWLCSGQNLYSHKMINNGQFN